MKGGGKEGVKERGGDEREDGWVRKGCRLKASPKKSGGRGRNRVQVNGTVVERGGGGESKKM
jgi:hypothetical protein